MNDINGITLGQIIGGITAIGILSGFFGKFFSQIYKIKQLSEKVEKLEAKVNEFEDTQIKQKSEILEKVEQTNTAVNLICLAVSALIDDSLQDNQETKQRLQEIKNKLDNKKEIV